MITKKENFKKLSLSFPPKFKFCSHFCIKTQKLSPALQYFAQELPKYIFYFPAPGIFLIKNLTIFTTKFLKKFKTSQSAPESESKYVKTRAQNWQQQRNRIR